MLHSNIVDDEYELSIWLPESYDTSEQSYPTLYVLDAPIFFGSICWNAWIQMLDAGIPDMIVVGIGKRMKKFDDWFWPIRWRDYSPAQLPGEPVSGHADRFLEFIGQELIPFIETNYRTRPDDRILWGQSLGGSFVMYALFSQTNLFRSYITSAPAFRGQDQVFRLVDYESALATASFDSEVRLFVSVGSLDQIFSPDVEAFMKFLPQQNIANLKFGSMIFEGLGHSAAAIPGFVYGIEAVYKM